MRWLVVLIMCILCLALLSCGDDDSTSPDDNTTYIYPLKIGNSWLSEIIYYNQQGAETSRDTFETTVARDTIIEGERWYQLARDSVLISGFVANRLDGFWAYSPRQLLFQYPTEEGILYTGPNNSVTEVESITDTVEVSAGEFCCYSYKKTSYGTDAFNRSKLAPGVGLVLNEVWYEGNDEVLIYRYALTTLLEYSVQ